MANSLIEKKHFYSKLCQNKLLIFKKINIIFYLDQEVYDFIDHNTEDVAVLEQGDAHIGSFVPFLKVKKQILITCSP